MKMKMINMRKINEEGDTKQYVTRENKKST